MTQSISQEGSMPTSPCDRSDMDEGNDRSTRIPMPSKADPEMFKRLNEKPFDEMRPSMVSDTSLPPFQNEIPVKSMDVSEVGFRERYQSALTQKNRV